MELFQKKTIGRIVDEMAEDQILEIKKENENARNHKLYLKEDSLLVSATLQLNEFENGFENLFYYIIENIKYIRTNKFPGKSNEELSTMDDANFPDCANAAPPFPRTSMLDLPIMQENLDIIISISSLMFASRGTRSECLDQKIIDRHFLLFFANSTLNNDNQPVLDIFKFNQVLDEIGVLN